MGQMAIEKNMLEFFGNDKEAPLKNFRILRGIMRSEVEEFIRNLPEPYKTFAVHRYIECQTMEKIAELMCYSPRSMYVFRKKVLKWWSLFLKGGVEDARKLQKA